MQIGRAKPLAAYRRCLEAGRMQIPGPRASLRRHTEKTVARMPSKNPLQRSIEWEKPNRRRVGRLLEDAGFSEPRIRWNRSTRFASESCPLRKPCGAWV